MKKFFKTIEEARKESEALKKAYMPETLFHPVKIKKQKETGLFYCLYPSVRTGKYEQS